MLRSKFKDASGKVVQEFGFTRDGNSQWLALSCAADNDKTKTKYWLKSNNDDAHSVTTHHEPGPWERWEAVNTGNKVF